MSRPMTRDEQAIADKIGGDVTVYIDRNDLTDISTMVATYTLKAGITLPKGNHDYDQAAERLKAFLAYQLEEQSGEFL